MNHAIKDCLNCGEKFESIRVNGKYCSSCRVPGKGGLKKLFRFTTKQCEQCQSEYTTHHHEQKYCSKECGFSSELRAKPPVNGEEYAPELRLEIDVYKRWGRLTKRFARLESISRKRAFRIQKISTILVCGECSTSFIGTNGRRTYCSDVCATKASNRNKGQKDRTRNCENKEHVNAFKVFARDGWTCQMCKRKTPRKLRGTIAPNAPEVDHIIPLSKGGDHTYLNTQLLCRQCNNDKSDKEIGQLLMFG
jgi:hypothetical protein